MEIENFISFNDDQNKRSVTKMFDILFAINLHTLFGIYRQQMSGIFKKQSDHF